MDRLIDAMREFNLFTVLTMAAIFWYFVRELRNEMKTEMAAQAARTDRLYEMFIDLLKDKKHGS